MAHSSKRLGLLLWVLLLINFLHSTFNLASNLTIPDIFSYSWDRLGLWIGYPLLSISAGIGIILQRRWGIYFLATFLLGWIVIYGNRVIAILILQPDKIFTFYYQTFFTSLIASLILIAYLVIWYFALREKYREFK